MPRWWPSELAAESDSLDFKASTSGLINGLKQRVSDLESNVASAGQQAVDTISSALPKLPPVQAFTSSWQDDTGDAPSTPSGQSSVTAATPTPTSSTSDETLSQLTPTRSQATPSASPSLTDSIAKLPPVQAFTNIWKEPKQQPEPAASSAPAPAQTPSGAATAVPPAMPEAGSSLSEQAQQATATTNQQVNRLTAPSSASAGPIDNSSRASFVKTAWPYMLEAAGGNRDAAEMMLAAAISENGSIGTGKPFWANNFFGIKGQGPAGSVNAATWEAGPGGERQNINDSFAAYNTPVEGFRGFFDFLQNNSRYAPALQRYRQTGDAQQLFQDINAAGYATDKQWASKVANIRANQVAPVVASVPAVPSTQPMGQTQPSPGLENTNKPAPQRTIVPVEQAAGWAPDARPADAPWIEQQRPPDDATMEQPLHPPYPSQTGAAVTSDTMYRQPLQQTPGDAFETEDASTSPGASGAPPWEQTGSSASGAGAFQDSQVEAAPVAPIPAAQVQPNEDATSYPRPEYVPPASPLVLQNNDSGSNMSPDSSSPRTYGVGAPSSPYDPQQAASMEPAPNRFVDTGEQITPSIVGAVAAPIARGIEQSMTPGNSLLDLPSQRISGRNADEVSQAADAPYLPPGVTNAINAARRAGFEIMTGAMAGNIASELWRAAGLPVANIAGFEINPGQFLVPGKLGLGGGHVPGMGVTSAAERAAINEVDPLTQVAQRGLTEYGTGAAGMIERGAEAAIGAGRGLLSRGAETVGSRLAGNAERAGQPVAREMANALPGEGSTIERGGAPMEKPPVWSLTPDAAKATLAEEGGIRTPDVPPQRHEAINSLDELQQTLAYYRDQGIPVYERATTDIQADARRGYSTNHQTGQREAGLSVNEVDPETTRQRLGELVGSNDVYGAQMRGVGEVRRYLVTGEEVGRGADNEPLLSGKSIRPLATLNPGVLDEAGLYADLKYLQRYPNDPWYAHRNLVSDALARGETVPPEVLAEWPELAKKHPEAFAPRGEPPGALPSAPSAGPATNAALLAAPGRAIAGGATGAVTGGAAGYESSPEGATPGETAARTLAGAGAGALAGTTIARSGTLAAGRVIDSLVERGALNPRLLASHPKTADRVRALFSVAAEGLPDDAPVPVPTMVQAMVRMRPDIAGKVSDLLGAPVTAGQVRQIVGAADSPGVAQTVQELVVDALTGLGARGRRGRELAADAATVRGISDEAARTTTGRTAEVLPALETPNGPARRVDPSTSPNLTSFVDEIADKLGVARPGVYLSDTPIVNAAATTDGKSPALIITRGLLNSGLTDDEMAAVLTHELAHTAQDSRGPVGRAFGAVRDAVGNLTGSGEREIQGALSSVPPEGERPPRTGNLTQAFGEKPGERVQFRFRVVPMEDLVTSHTNALGINPSFPSELQPRVRERAASRAQIERIMKEFDPEQMLVDTHTVDRGPMIVGADNVVESGNGRSIALRRLAEEHPAEYQRYVDELRGSLNDYGLSEADLQGIRNPVLVRERMTDVNRAQFAASANVGAIDEMAPIERAFQDAGRLAPEHVAGLTVGEGQSIDQALLAPANIDAVRAFVGAVPPAERGALLDANGNLSSAGLERLKSALLVKTYTGEAGTRIATAFVESTDPGVRNVENAIYASLPSVARAEALIGAGERDAGLSIAPDVAVAVDVYARLKRAGMSVPDYLAQAPMFGERETNAVQDQILQYLNDNARSPRRIREMLEGYANAVDNQADAAQVGMFGEASRATKEEVLNGVTRELGAAPTDAGANLGGIGAGGEELAGAGQRPPAASEPSGGAQASGSGDAAIGDAETSLQRFERAQAGQVAPRTPASEIIPSTNGPAGTLQQQGSPPAPSGPLTPANQIVPSTGGAPGTLAAQGAPTSLRPANLPPVGANAAPSGGAPGTLAQQGAPVPLTAPSGVAPVGPRAAPVGGPAGTLAQPGAPRPVVQQGTPGVNPIAHLPPQVQQALQQAQAQATPGLPPLTWLRRFAGEAGNSSMLGVQALTTNLFNNLLEPVWATPKEFTRAALPQAMGGRGNLDEWGAWMTGGLHGLTNVSDALIDVLKARGKYAAVPGHEPLSQVTNNPVGKALANFVEFGTRVVAGAPDAIFGEVARGQAEYQRAAQIATDAVRSGALKKSDWRPAWAALIEDAENVKAGQLPQFNATQDVIDAGDRFAKRQTQQGELGTWGKNVKDFATLAIIPDGQGGRKPVPVLGNLITPYFNSPWAANLRLMERTPGVGALMDTQHGFDKVYDQAMGSALVLGVAGLASQGTVTGKGPSDPEKRQEMMSLGWRPYSSLVNGVYVPNRVIWGVAAPLANTAGDVHDAIAYQKPGAGSMDVGADMLGRFGSQLKQQPYLQGVSDALSLLDPSQPMGSKVAQYVASTATRMVPYASTIRAASTSQDPMERTTDRGKNVDFGTQVSQRVQSALGMRGDLPVAQDVLGRPQANPQQGWGALFAKTSPEKADPIIKAFLDSGVDIGFPPPQFTIDNPIPGGKSFEIPMSPDEQRAWNRARGAKLTEMVTPKLNDPSFQNLPPASKQANYQKFLELANKQANFEIQKQLGPVEINRRIREGFGKAS